MKTTKKTKRTAQDQEADSTYFLKIVLFIVLGSLWIKFQVPLEIGMFTLSAFPVGLFLGLVFASHDHFQVDRKIEYAVLIVVAVLTFFLPAGIIV